MRMEDGFYVETGGNTTDVCLAAWWLPEQGNAREPTPANTPGTKQPPWGSETSAQHKR